MMDPIFLCLIFLLVLNKFFDQRTFPVLESKFKTKPSLEVKIKKLSVILPNVDIYIALNLKSRLLSSLDQSFVNIICLLG